MKSGEYAGFLIKDLHFIRPYKGKATFRGWLSGGSVFWGDVHPTQPAKIKERDSHLVRHSSVCFCFEILTSHTPHIYSLKKNIAVESPAFAYIEMGYEFIYSNYIARIFSIVVPLPPTCTPLKT